MDGASQQGQERKVDGQYRAGISGAKTGESLLPFLINGREHRQACDSVFKTILFH